MDYSDITAKMRGVIPFLPTPYLKKHGNGTKLDENGLRKNCRFLNQFPFDCVVPVAGTGDLMSLENKEYFRILEICKEELDASILIMPGLFLETERAIKAVKVLEKMNFRSVLSFPAPHLAISSRGLVAHWKTIARNTSLAITVFRAPWLPFDLNLLEELKDKKNIVAIKEETGDILWFRKAIESYGDRYAVIGGGELQFLNYLLVGAQGITTGLPNFMPEPFFRMFQLAENNKYQEAIILNKKLMPLLTLRQKPGNAIPLLKYAMDLVGLCGGVNRLPQMELTDEDKSLTRKYLCEIGVIKQN